MPLTYEEAAAAVISFSQAEVCAAGTRMLVENSTRMEFVSRVVAALECHWMPGDPLNPVTRVGALEDSTQLDTGRAVEEGVQIDSLSPMVSGPFGS